MAEGKWISGLSAADTLAAAARRVLEIRLKAVCDWLPKAVFEADKDPEHVHQLRVSTRRAGAALRIFRSCLADKDFRKVRKRLRTIRRAAGEARDWDVFLSVLVERQAQATERQRPGFDFLLGHAFTRRALAQESLVQANQARDPGLEALVSQTLAAIGEPQENIVTLADMAGPHLTELAGALADAASQDLQPYEHLHQVRILGKRLRYAMEIFAGCYGKPFREQYYPSVVEMQEILGEANDSHSASQRLAALRDQIKRARRPAWKRLQPGIETLLRFHQRRLPQLRRKFEQWWCRWQQLEALAAFGNLG
jgi:CHAD domain-containing protein